MSSDLAQIDVFTSKPKSNCSPIILKLFLSFPEFYAYSRNIHFLLISHYLTCPPSC